MKISTKGRYAVRLMLEIAIHDASNPISLKEIAKRQDISEKYLEQIIATLNKAGFVRSIRGPQGGYFLVKDAKDYTVGQILRTTEGDLAPVSCVGSDGPMCDKIQDCVTAIVWKKVNDAVNDVVDSITLADLVEWQKEKGNDYVI